MHCKAPTAADSSDSKNGSLDSDSVATKVSQLEPEGALLQPKLGLTVNGTKARKLAASQICSAWETRDASQYVDWNELQMMALREFTLFHHWKIAKRMDVFIAEKVAGHCNITLTPIWLVRWFVTDIVTSLRERNGGTGKKASEAPGKVKVEKVAAVTNAKSTGRFQSMKPLVASTPQPQCPKPIPHIKKVQQVPPHSNVKSVPWHSALKSLPPLDMFDDDVLEAASSPELADPRFDIKFVDDDLVAYPVQKSSAQIREAAWAKGEQDVGICYDGATVQPELEVQLDYLPPQAWGQAEELSAVRSLLTLRSAWQLTHHPLALLSGPQGTQYQAHIVGVMSKWAVILINTVLPHRSAWHAVLPKGMHDFCQSGKHSDLALPSPLNPKSTHQAVVDKCGSDLHRRHVLFSSWYSFVLNLIKSVPLPPSAPPSTPPSPAPLSFTPLHPTSQSPTSHISVSSTPPSLASWCDTSKLVVLIKTEPGVQSDSEGEVSGVDSDMEEIVEEGVEETMEEIIEEEAEEAEAENAEADSEAEDTAEAEADGEAKAEASTDVSADIAPTKQKRKRCMAVLDSQQTAASFQSKRVCVNTPQVQYNANLKEASTLNKVKAKARALTKAVRKAKPVLSDPQFLVGV
ncbi:hypothetical protein BOTBODRAFT_45052 [Botryobasidium botryosum FD-172 SS1]|uniref:Uncharacterized protein n=1 Tax=Botryobasidium botryosum (strain FD-172 SS1) TaxID=930990 RepID=A0A067MCV5_BOTB1|nr:hypothetical protein BOTBODRAFT_45052 [Botryobasidium botryosum FD-172 SS1]